MSEKGLVTASGEAGYDPMRQFAELAGDVRDPYPMFAGIRAETPEDVHIHGLIFRSPPNLPVVFEASR